MSVRYESSMVPLASVDRDMRLRIVLPAALAARLWQLLGDNLTDEEKASRAP